MKLRRLLVALALVASYSSCYSEIINGVSPNAAQPGLDWVMTNVIPNHTGLTVNGVAYRYTTVKNTEDDMVVSVENDNALGTGLIFQSTDVWSGLPGNTIQKVVPVANIPQPAWGNGRISVDGVGQVKDASVSYSYTYDTCDEPLLDPRCPEYAAAMAAWLKERGLGEGSSVEDPYNDENVQKALKEKIDLEAEKERQERSKAKAAKDEKSLKSREQLAKEAAKNTLVTAEAVAAAAALEAMNNIPNFEVYYTKMPGGTYADAAVFITTSMSDNIGARRVGLAQQVLHNKLVDQQYNTKEK